MNYSGFISEIHLRDGCHRVCFSTAQVRLREPGSTGAEAVRARFHKRIVDEITHRTSCQQKRGSSSGKWRGRGGGGRKKVPCSSAFSFVSVVLKGHFFTSSGELLLVFLPLTVAPPRLEGAEGAGGPMSEERMQAGRFCCWRIECSQRQATRRESCFRWHFQNKSLKRVTLWFWKIRLSAVKTIRFVFQTHIVGKF